jgi:carboxylesterase type B
MHYAPAWPQPLPPPDSFYREEFFRTSERQSEDCFYLNIWAPARTPDEKLPVMVWFYDGGFVQGSGVAAELCRRSAGAPGRGRRDDQLTARPAFLALPALCG